MTLKQREMLLQTAIFLAAHNQINMAKNALIAVSIYDQCTSQPRYFAQIQEHTLWIPLAQLVAQYPHAFQPVFLPRLVLGSEFWATLMPTLTLLAHADPPTHLPIPFKLYSSPYTRPAHLLAPVYPVNPRKIPTYAPQNA